MPESRPSDAVLCVEIVSLRAIRIEFSCRYEAYKLASTSGKSRSRAVIAEDITPEYARGTRIVTKEDEGIGKWNEPFINRCRERLCLLSIMVCNESLLRYGLSVSSLVTGAGLQCTDSQQHGRGLSALMIHLKRFSGRLSFLSSSR